MRKKIFFVLFTGVIFILFSCTGPAGPEGPTGPEGPAGPQIPGLYFIRIFQNGVYSSTYTGQVESSIFGNEAGAYYTNNLMPISIGVKNVLGRYRAILKFDLSSLPNSKIIVDKAELTLKTSSINYGGGAYNVTVHKITSSWNVFEAGWQIRQLTPEWKNWKEFGGDYDANTITPQSATINILANSTITIELDPKVVENWMKYPETNYGIIFKVVDELQLNNYAEIYPGGASNPENRPKLKVWYYTVE